MSTPAKKSPTRFGYNTAALVAVGFAAIAAWPYIAQAAERLTAGQPVTAATVKADVEKKAKEQEKKAMKDKAFEPKALFPQADGSILLGAKQGLYQWSDGKLAQVSEFPGMEVRGLAAGKGGELWAAAKDGAWVRSGTAWKKAHEGDFHGVAVTPDGAVLLAGKMGVLRSADGANWETLKGTETGWKPEPKPEEQGEKEKKY